MERAGFFFFARVSSYEVIVGSLFALRRYAIQRLPSRIKNDYFSFYDRTELVRAEVLANRRKALRMEN